MKKTMKLASRGRRLAAGLIDMAVPFVAYLIMTTVYGMSIMSAQDPFGYGYGYGYNYNYDYNGPQTRGAYLGMVVLIFILLAYIIAELVLYARAQSIGKSILGLQVVSSKDGKPFGFWKMMLRECIVKNASSSVFLLGFIWILLDERNRGWHDKILDSYVVDLKETANMHQRAAATAPKQAPEAEEIFREREENAVTEDEPQPRIEAPAKVEALDAPVEVEAVEAPIEIAEVETAAGDAQTDESNEKDDAEIE